MVGNLFNFLVFSQHPRRQAFYFLFLGSGSPRRDRAILFEVLHIPLQDMAELDRFCDAMILIRDEIKKIENGTWPADDNPLKMAPHTQSEVCATEWKHPYTREEAAFPAPWSATESPKTTTNIIQNKRKIISSSSKSI
eukprot:5964801-Amphidinium_carterae.1